MRQLFFLAILFFSLQINAQIASYNFENNLDDGTANFNADFLENGEISSNTPVYLTGATGQTIQLDPTTGVQFPIALNGQIDTETSLELEFTFTLTDIGTGPGRKYLIGNQAGDNAVGFHIFTRHDLFSSEPNFEVTFTYADGGFNQGIPDHPGHEETQIGFFNEGDLIDVKLIFDFENNQWNASVNGVYTSAPFNDAYDLGIIKNSLLQNSLTVGWETGQQFADPGNFTSTATFDNLAFYSPRNPGNETVLLSALQAMTAHVNNSTPLSIDVRKNYLTDILLNYHGNFVAAEIDIYNFIAAYETSNPPVFADRQQVSFATLLPETQVLIFLQQKIHDEQFTPANIANMEGVKFETAEIFPGTVAENAPRLNDQIVEVNGSYSIIPGARIAADLLAAKRPTGYYVAPGEIVTVTIPNEFIDAGLSAMVGAHDADHSARTVTNRFVRISKDFPLNNVTTQVGSPFGGALYIRIPEGSDLDWFEITIDGAVKSPYFSARTGRETNPADWQNELAAQYVAWVDMESDKYMMTLPLNHVENLTDPTSLLQQWNDIMDGFNYVGGRPAERTRAEYFLLDSRLPADAFGTGYPQVIGDGAAPYGNLGSTVYYPTHVLNPEFYISEINTTFHEMGHGALHPTLTTEVETIIHVNAVYVYNQLYDLPLDDAFKYSSQEFLSLDAAAIDWMIAANFKNNNSMGCDPTMLDYLCDELRYQHRGHAKYVDMVGLFDWSAVHGMNKVFYDDWSVNPIGQQLLVTPDEVIRAASGAVGINMAPLMHFWGLIPSTDLQIELANLPESDEILQRLIYYRDVLTPNSATEFQPWYDNNVPKKDPVHLDRYNAALANYDSENCGQAIKDQINFLITTYFPNYVSTAELTEVSGNFTVSPNPTDGQIQIKNTTTDEWSIQVFNLSGERVYAKEKVIGSNFKFELQKPAGIYIIELNTGNSSQRFRVVKN